MSKINLNTKRHGIHSVDGADILTNNVLFPFAYNPHKIVGCLQLMSDKQTENFEHELSQYP